MIPHDYDALIIGGGPAGLSAALYIGRARKRVLVLDGGAPRHAASKAVHNFITRDGISPHAFREQAWAQMRAYPGVTHLPHVHITSLDEREGIWYAVTSTGETFQAPAVLLATGVVDDHLDIPGYNQFWGHTIHHCPYCHGWEMQERPIAVITHGEMARHMPKLLRGWSDDVIVLTHGQTLEDEIIDMLNEANIPIYNQQVQALTGEGNELREIVLDDGTRLLRQALFVPPSQRCVPLVAQLQLDMEHAFVKVDEFHATSRPGLWAAGDICSPRMQQVVMSAAQGAIAGAMINATLTSH